jgi:chromosome segregation ATPase
MSSNKKSNTNSSKSLSVDVQGKLGEFYKVAKERLLEVKNDLETSKKEYLAQKEINRKKELEYNSLLSESKDLDLKIKGLNEKIVNAKRTQNYIRSQIELTKSEILNANSEIDFLKLETDAKVKRISNENQKINTSKEYQLKSIKERLQKEKSTNKDLKEKIKEAETRIKEISGKIENASVQENKKNIAILKELADMNKFLSEL